MSRSTKITPTLAKTVCWASSSAVQFLQISLEPLTQTTTVLPTHSTAPTTSNPLDHFSEIATVEANWDLHTLGRFDVGANVFSFVAKTTKDEIRTLADLSNTYLNESYPGIFNNKVWAPMPRPNIELVVNGRTVLQKVKDIWGALNSDTVYAGALEIPSAANPPKYA